MATDKELVKRVQNGESEAYAELFRRYYQHIYAICVSMVENPQDAEELAQEMFVLAYLKVDQLRDPARFFPWLKKMARNRSRNFLQRRKADVIPLSLVDMRRSSVNPEEEMLRQELIQAIMEAIEALPAGDRQVVRARIDGLSHAEISRRFGISYRASLSRLYRARRKLADRLKGLYSIFGLVGKLRPREIISGGIVAMKIGTSAKVTIGVISVLAVGFIGFQIATRQPDQGISPPDPAVQETSAKSLRTFKTSQQTPDKKDIEAQTDSTTALPDSSEESVTAEEAKDFLAFLDQMDNQENSERSEETVVDPKDELFLRRFRMTRAEVEEKTAELEKELDHKVTLCVYLFTQANVEPGTISDFDSATRSEMYEEYNRLWETLTIPRPSKLVMYSQYMKALGRGDPLAEGGWLYELQRPLPKRIISSPLR